MFEIGKDKEDVKFVHDASKGVIISSVIKVKKTHILPKTLKVECSSSTTRIGFFKSCKSSHFILVAMAAAS